MTVRPDQAVVGSAEYIYGDWLFAAEWSSRWIQHETTNLLGAPSAERPATTSGSTSLRRTCCLATSRSARTIRPSTPTRTTATAAIRRSSHSASWRSSATLPHRFATTSTITGCSARGALHRRRRGSRSNRPRERDADEVLGHVPVQDHGDLLVFHRKVICLIPICLLALSCATASIAANDNLQGHRPIGQTRDYRRRSASCGTFFLKKTTEWHRRCPRSVPVDLSRNVPPPVSIVYPGRFEEDSVATQELLEPADLPRKNVPPPEAGSAADMISYVLGTPGAVGYLPAGVDPGGDDRGQ